MPLWHRRNAGIYFLMVFESICDSKKSPAELCDRFGLDALHLQGTAEERRTLLRIRTEMVSQTLTL